MLSVDPYSTRLPVVYGQEILRCRVGSSVHGMATEESDRDEMGICIEPPELVIGLENFEQWTWRTKPLGVRSGAGDLDLTVYSLRKYVSLACAGNPSIIILLFVPPEDTLIITSPAESLRANSQMFMSHQVASRFMGYMTAQREGMLGLRGKHTNRPELIKLHGYDTKFAYHMIRLGLQGVELLTTGKITLPIPYPERAWLKQLRKGAHSRETVLARAVDLEAQLLALKNSLDWPESVDEMRVNRWLVETYQDAWETQLTSGQ